MDIYILRDGEQIGPFSRDAAQILIEQGSVSVETLAWRQGTEDWRPLGEVLGDGPAEGSAPPEPPVFVAPSEPSAELASEPSPAASEEPHVEGSKEPVTEEKAEVVETGAETPAEPTAEESPKASAEPATAAEIAFLSYFSIAIPAGLSKDDAEALMAKAREDPHNVNRLEAWELDRLRLHPDLFGNEKVQPKKEDRVQLFFDLCQTAGADHFTGVTKAHCQVLVAFLDVKFPRWDANEADATERYFFPAIAEKFPQLVNKVWRGQLHYGDAPHIAGRKSPTAKLAKKSGSPLWAVVRGVAWGLVILAMLYLFQLSRQPVKAVPPAAAPVEKAPAEKAQPAAEAGKSG